MPHFGLMDDGKLGPVEGPLMRARLHIRGGRRRLRQGKISLGILTLYDALVHAMHWYMVNPDHRKHLNIKEEDIRDDKIMFGVLNQAGILDGTLDYDELNRIVERALQSGMNDFDYREILERIESVMTQLGVMPFDENQLPPEDPSTV